MITINLDKAKQIAHVRRRAAREVEFAPHDTIIAKQIPGVSAADAEAARQAIRNKYAVIQLDIDSSADIDTLTAIVKAL